MFRLRSKLIFSIFKYETRNDLCLILHKNMSAVQSNGHKLKKSICNYHYDALDVYTNTLILENVSKWKTDNNFSTTNKLAKCQSNSIFKSCDDPDHLLKYLQQCLDGYCKVSESVLTQFMLTMSKHGQINGLELIEKLNAKYDYCIKKSELQMHLAEAYWINGDLNNMFKHFVILYQTESAKVNHVLDPIIYTIVKSRGGASVVMVIQFVNSIVIKYEDHHPMCILWKYLFLSELYNDNLEADKLMRQNSHLMEHIKYLVPIITKNMLKKHKIDCVQRLMIILLKHNQMKTYQWILRSLFEYYCEYFIICKITKVFDNYYLNTLYLSKYMVQTIIRVTYNVSITLLEL